MTFQILDCKGCLGGEFAGTIDLKVACDTATLERPADRFTLRTPVDAEPLEVLGVRVEDDGFDFTFSSEAIVQHGEIPENVSLLLDDKEIGASPCRLWDSMRLTSARFENATEILQGAALPPMGSIRTQRWRGPLMGSVGLGSLSLAAVLVAGGMTSDGFDHTTSLVMASLVATIGLIALGLMWVPFEEVFIDFSQGRVRAVRGRFVFLRFQELGVSQHSLRDFSHLRIVERVETDSDGDQRDVFLVFLEGPVEWGADDGTVNCREDSVHIKNFGSRESARHYAAKIAFPSGLRILDTSITEL